MLSNNPAEPIQKDACDARAGAAEAPVLDPRSPIEVASGGNGTINDPSGTDKPPGVAGNDLLG